MKHFVGRQRIGRDETMLIEGRKKKVKRKENPALEVWGIMKY